MGRGSEKLRYANHKKGQAVVEMALFGSLIILVLGVFLSYVQRLNDQHYVQMEAFRRALYKACTYQGEESEGAGGSVQLTMMQNRRHIDLQAGYRKGSPQSLGGSASVFWAVPKVGKDPENIITFKINENEQERNYRDFVPKAHDDDWTFRTEDITTTSDTVFSDTATKIESPEDITTTKTSQLQDTESFHIPYTVRKKDHDHNDENDPIVREGTLWDLTQGVYIDAEDGQYKYREDAVGTQVERGTGWTTEF